MFRKYIPLIIVVLLSFWSISPLFNSGFFPMHDNTQVARVFEMKKALNDGMVPVRWVPDLGYGYGYPIFNFYAPFAYYVGALISLIGIDVLVATKLMIGIAMILSGIFMYFFAKNFWGEKGGVIAGLLYVYAPYHAINLYVRGAVSELWAYAFLPLIFLSIYKIFLYLEIYTGMSRSSKLLYETRKSIWNWVSISAISYALVLLSHNLTAMMITPFVFTFAIILYVALRTKNKIYKPYCVLLGLLIGMLLSAFYWLPVLPELRYTNVLSVVGGGSDYKDHFVCIQQLWSSPWGFGGSVSGCIDGMSFKIGKIHVILALLSMPAAFYYLRDKKFKLVIMLYFAVSAAFSVFIMTEYSKVIWDFIPQMAFFQFPWRFLILVSFFTSFFGGAIVMYFTKKNNFLTYGFTAILIVLVLIYSIKLFTPQRLIQTSGKNLTEKLYINWTVSKISDEYMPKYFKTPVTKDEVPVGRFKENKNIKLTNVKEKTQLITFSTDANLKTDLGVNLAYFPGWHVFIDGKQTWYRYYNQGMIVEIPPGKHDFQIRFTQTNIEKIGNFLSVLGVLIPLYGIISHRKSKKYGKSTS